MTALGMGHLSQKGPCPEHLALFQSHQGLSVLDHWNGDSLGKICEDPGGLCGAEPSKSSLGYQSFAKQFCGNKTPCASEWDGVSSQGKHLDFGVMLVDFEPHHCRVGRELTPWTPGAKVWEGQDLATGSRWSSQPTPGSPRGSHPPWVLQVTGTSKLEGWHREGWC